MSKASYSKVDTYWSCPYLYKLRYIDKLKAKPDTNPASALYEGTAVHEGIEKRNLKEGLDSYKSNFDQLSVEHEFEMFKLEKSIMKGIEQIPHGEYEYKILTDDFIGFIDMLVKVDEGVYDLYDFKYSSNINGYKDSAQVHIYKYYYEKITGNTIRDMYYVFIPKCSIKYSEDYSLNELKDKVNLFYSQNDVVFSKIDFDRQKVNYFFARKTLMEKETSFEKRYTFKCGWCEFQNYCKTNGKDRSELIDDNPKEVDL